jgi:hypothetical protein
VRKPNSLVENAMKSRTKNEAEDNLHKVKEKTDKRWHKRMRDPTLEGKDENKVGRIESLREFPSSITKPSPA